MKKKFISVALSLVMAASLMACGGGASSGSTDSAPVGDSAAQDSGSSDAAAPEASAEGGTTIKVGMVCIGDENDQGYTYNFIRGEESASEILAAKGINVEWINKYNVVEDDGCTDANIELAEEGCQLIIDNSFGHEEFMLKVAPDYPEIQFVSCTNQASATDGLDNTHNAFANIYEGRYLAGVVAGMKMQELIDNGEITPDQAVIGYVGAFAYAEVISGFSSYYLGVKSVCPSATMKVRFVDSWSDATAEGNAASALCDEGCIMISQHSDNTTPATTAQSKGAFHTGYNNDMTGIAPDASLVGTRIDWGVYLAHAIECVANGTELEQDWCEGINQGAVVLTELNEGIIAAGTKEKLAEVEAGIKDGSVKVFDIENFTVDGAKVTQAYALDTDGDWVPDSQEAIVDGQFVESYYQSAPYFGLHIDGIEY